MACIYLIDDHPLVCEGLSVALQRAGHRVTGFTTTLAGAVADPAMSKAELIVLDLSLGDGVDIFQTSGLFVSGRRILVYSMHEERIWIDRAFAAGVSGYAAKRETPECLLEGIRQVLSGNRYVSPKIAASVVPRGPLDGEELAWSKLSDRELQAVHALSQGSSAAETAERLCISPRTVEAYYGRIIAKLGISGMRELRRMAIQAAQKGELPFPADPPRP